MERSILEISLRDKVRNNIIRSKISVSDVVGQVVTMKWRWADHVARCKDERWNKRLLSFRMKETEDIITRGCKKLENTTPLLRLKKYLFCNYDSTIRPNHHKVVTNITLRLMPKMMEFTEDGVLTLHSWMSFFWTDAFLTWTPSSYNGLTYIHVQPFYLWMPDIYVYNSGDMTSNDYETIFNTECLVFNNGSVICVPPVKIVSKCDPDYTYWPYDQHTCLITLGSWSHIGEEMDVHLDGTGVDMNGYENNTQWDMKLLNAEKVVKKYKCCPNDTFPRIDYTFLLTRHYSIHYRAYIAPAIALIFLTLTVLWLDSRSVERVAMASINFICHLLCIFDLYWMVPFNGVNSPYIMLFYRDSLMLATFALILTALLRKLQNMSMEMPSWISSTTTFILNNKAGRFLVLNDEESKIADGGIVTEDNSDTPKSEMKKESWRHFTAIIEWLSFFCVILTYVIILITLVLSGVTN
ncbi:ACH1 protein, partial [Acromyrmex heyeri]